MHGRVRAIAAQTTIACALGVWAAEGVEAKSDHGEDSFCRVCSAIAAAMGEKAGEKWTVAVALQPTSLLPHRLLDPATARNHAQLHGGLARGRANGGLQGRNVDQLVGMPDLDLCSTIWNLFQIGNAIRASQQCPRRIADIDMSAHRAMDMAAQQHRTGFLKYCINRFTRFAFGLAVNAQLKAATAGGAELRNAGG